MHPTKAIFLLVVLMGFGKTFFAQNQQGNFDQLLTTGIQKPVENIDAFLDTPYIERDEIVNGHFYRLLQFFEIPTASEKKVIEQTGIQLFSYLPHKTFLAAIPRNFDVEELSNLNIRNITKFQASQKIHPAVSDHDEKIVLEYYPNLSTNLVRNFLKNKNIEVHEFLETNKGRVGNLHAVVICNASLDLERLASFSITSFISPAQLIAEPEYIPGKNINRSNFLTPKIEGYQQYNGAGVHIAIGDDGMISSHLDFKNRVDESEVLGDESGNHGEMVAGILAGAGNLNPRMEGTASHASLHLLPEFDAIKKATALYQQKNVLITSTSYSDGCNRGYTNLAQMADYQMRVHPSLLHVFSAGNSGNEDCGYGAGVGWGNITGGVKMGKNVLTVANVNSEDERSTTSSRGPANDGRIKPDISAIGDDQFSTQPNNTYAAANGSSAAAPGVAGILAQLYQAYAAANEGGTPKSELIKATILNTADDLGNPGPDFSYGYGRINARRAHNVISNRNYFESTIGQSNGHSHFISVPAETQQLRVMLYWNDYESSTLSSTALVNDLDFQVVNAEGTTYLPWVLNSSPDSALLNLPAVRGEDHLNNMEQVTIDLPKGGLYSLLVTGTAVAHGAQNYHLVYEFVSKEITLTYPFGGEKLVPGELEKIHWDAFGNEENFEIEVSYNNGLTWELLGLVTGEKRSFNWEVPAVNTQQAKIRVSRNEEQGVCIAPFSIFEVPQNLRVTEVCPEEIRLEWDEVANADQYIIYKLGEKYMENFSSTNFSYIDISIENPAEENWYAIAALGENGLLSRRSLAVSDGTDLLNCDLEIDLTLHSIASPNNAILQSCFEEPMTVSINITNTGTTLQTQIPIFYLFDNQLLAQETYKSSIPPNVTVNYIFNQKIPAASVGPHTLRVWVAQPNDQATFNDSASFHLEVVPSASTSLPYFENFDEFENCDATANCEISCALQSGWYNDENRKSDDIDWMVNQGATTTAETGPNFDQNTNNENGKYLYLEGSGGCTNKTANLLSPCFDLSEAVQPVFSFWYHMQGAHMGQLHVDLFDGTTWFYNITPTLNGEQGNDWQEVEIDLSVFSSKVVTLRLRGMTGSDYLTDLAIDNVALFDAQSAPYPNFKAAQLTSCPQSGIQFIDNSVNTPNAWSWSFEPNSVTFLGGTSATDANPVVAFNSTGTYDVTLVATNDFGAAQKIKEQYVHISAGEAIPYGDTFDAANLDILKWKIHNPDHGTTWETLPSIGRDGQPTNVAYVNNHSYNAVGEKDELESLVIDLTEAQTPFLRFDWAYASFNSTFKDGLQVWLSADCGENFEHLVFEKYGTELATVEEQINAWFPQNSYDWKTAKIDLSDFVGSSVVLRLVNVNGFGNNLFLDNFLVYEKEDFPNAKLFAYPEQKIFCLGEESLTFLTNTSTDYDYVWNFGTNATPYSASTYGPHVVNLETTGTYHVSLRASNALGYDMAETTLEVIDNPVADFDYSLQNGEVVFTNHSVFGENYFWDFGDGSTSSLENPIHSYSSNNAFTAELIVTNLCGRATTSQTLIISTGTQDLKNNFFINAFPNPTDDFIVFNMPAFNVPSMTFDIVDMRGMVVAQFDLNAVNGLFSFRLDASKLAQGMYFARAKIEGQFFVEKFVKTL